MKRILITTVSLALLVICGLYIRQVVYETVQTRNPGQRYLVSLGDSVAAGAGLNSAGKGSDGCDVAPTAYPYVLAKQLNAQAVQFACSGATVAAVKNSTNNVIDSQLNSAKPYIAGSDVVIYAGANDVQWLDTLVSCAKTNCATPQIAAKLESRISTMQANLAKLITAIQLEKPRKIIVNTYYGLVASGDTCAVKLGVTPEETTFIVTEEVKFNQAISSAGKQAGATIVTIDFTGHTLCNPNPWIQNISEHAPFHPTVAGQQQIADQDTAVLK